MPGNILSILFQDISSAGIDHHPQEGDHVLDVGLLEEPQPAP